MKVKLARRLGNNPEGSVVDLSTAEAEHLLGRGVATTTEDDVAEPFAAAEDKLTLAELKTRAEELGVATWGTKAQLAQRIYDAETADV